MADDQWTRLKNILDGFYCKTDKVVPFVTREQREDAEADRLANLSNAEVISELHSYGLSRIDIKAAEERSRLFMEKHASGVFVKAPQPE